MMKGSVKQSIFLKGFSACMMALCMIFAMPSSVRATDVGREASISGKIVVDGDLSDWENITALESKDSKIDEWKTAMDEEGNLYLCFTGTAVSQWDGDYQWKVLGITQNQKTENLQIASLKYKGAEVSMVNEANGNTAASYYVEIMMPASYFTDANFTVTLASVAIPADSIEVVDGTEAAVKEESVYDGIVIDGKFSDWTAVEKAEVTEKNGAGIQNLSAAVMVFDGDYVYIYLKETEGGSAAGVGTQSNGKYVILTDINRVLLFQLTGDGKVSGIENARASHVGSQWEISIPAEAVPNYLSTISLQTYTSNTLISGVRNLNGEANDSSGNIVYDGKYADWSYYPHSVIQDTSIGALYSNGESLYGHFETTMQAHLRTGGYELTRNITIKFNDDENTVFYPRLVAVDAKGNINWDPQRANLADGTYEFYLVSLDAWGTSDNISNLNAHDQIYGKMMVTVNGGEKDECEFELYLDRLAEKLNMSKNDFKTMSAKFGELGNAWVTLSGTSTGPYLGVFICCAAVAVVLLICIARGKAGVKKS